MNINDLYLIKILCSDLLVKARDKRKVLLTCEQDEKEFILKNMKKSIAHICDQMDSFSVPFIIQNKFLEYINDADNTEKSEILYKESDSRIIGEVFKNLDKDRVIKSLLENNTVELNNGDLVRFGKNISFGDIGAEDGLHLISVVNKFSSLVWEIK